MTYHPATKLIDESGNAYGVKHVNNKPRVSSMPYTYDISEGNVANHSVWQKIGYREASTSGTEVTVSPQLSAAEYVFPTGVKTMTIVSNSDNDDGDPVGTGARTVTVYYLNGSYEEKSVTVTMNGQTSVQIGTDVFRIQNVRVASVGDLNATAGILTIASGGVTYGYVRAGKTRARQCIWTVPYGKCLYVTSIAFSASNMGSTKYARFTTKATFDDKSGLVLRPEFFLPFNEVGLMNSSYFRELNPPTKLPATTDLKVTCATNDTGTVITTTLRGWTETA